MNTAEMVTTFSLEDGKQPVKTKALIKALNTHLKTLDLQCEGYPCESFCCYADWTDKEQRIPEKFRWLVAYAVEGESEGWYVHVGSIYQGTYTDFGHCKCWSADDAYAICREAQRFLTAARWA